MVSLHKRKIIPMVILIIAALTVPPSLILCDSEDSDAASTIEWYFYGHQLKLSDDNYDPIRYSSIEWRYSLDPLSESNPGEVIPSDPGEGYSADMSLDPAVFPYWIVTTMFVREIATMTNGEVKMADFIIHVNPIEDMCYFEFMYDGEHPYIYMHVTRQTSVEKGVTAFVDLPPEPTRDGYSFGGWYTDQGCTEPFDNMDPKIFRSADEIITIYPKWIATGGSTPSGSTMHFVMLQTVNGLSMQYDGLAVQKGSGFSFTVSVVDGSKFDISEMKAVTSAGRTLSQTDNPDGSITYTLPSVDSDITIMLTGYRQYFKVTTSFDNVSTVGFEEWVLQGSSLTLPLASSVGGDVSATVFMGTTDVTGNTFSDGVVKIPSITGDVTIYASSVEKPAPPEKEESFPWEYVAIAAIVIAVVLALALVMRMRNREV